MKTINNSNGRIYDVLAENGSYMLLQCQSNKEYVVAYNFTGSSWSSGSYFFNYEYALKCFNEKSMFSSRF